VNDQNFITRVQEGDSAAWKALLQQHQQAVFRLAYLLLGDADEAEDVAQETFIRAHQAISRVDPSRDLRPWLLKITVNLVRNHRRSVGRYLAALQRFFQMAPDTRSAAADSEVGEAEALQQAIKHLRVVDQEIIYMRYFLELSVSETRQALGIAPGTVKSRLNRALGRLRQIIQSEFPEL